MHELSIATSIIEIVTDELQKHGASKLTLVRVKYGRLTNIVAEALHMGFTAVCQDAGYQGAVLELEELPVVLKCGACNKEFTVNEKEIIAIPCPHCGQRFGHEVISGKELFVDHIDAE